jgi:hypothetical protein
MKEMPAMARGPSSKPLRDVRAGPTAFTQTLTPELFRDADTFYAPEVIVVSTIAGLRQAVKEQRPEIIYRLPDWLKPPDSFPKLLNRIYLSMLALVILALAMGYNVEFGPKIVVKGIEISFPVKLTKPPAHP